MRRSSGLLIFLIPVFVAAAVAEAADALVARSFRLRCRSVDEVASAVGEMLSARGSLTVKPSAGEILVEDERAVVDKVARFIEKVDRPGPAVQLKFKLYQAMPTSKEEEAQGELPEGLDRSLVRFLGPCRFVELGSTTVEVALPSQVRARIGNRFGVRFKGKRVVRAGRPAGWGLLPGSPFMQVRLEDLVLFARKVRDDGSLEVRELVRSGVVIAPGQRVMIAATRAPGNGEGLVLVVEAKKGGG